MNVLLVDDEPLELEQLEYLIMPHFPHWSFYKAQDASQALSIAQKHKITLSFLDIHLPGKSGLELAAELKQNYTMAIIMVTAFQTFSYAQTAIRLGVNDYITKPVIESELLSILNPFKKLSAQSSIIQQVITIIQKEYDSKLSLDYIGSKIHLNPTYLSRKFHKEMGMSFTDYLHTFRIEIAKKYLIEQKDWSISVISEKCGFNSQHYFSSSFNKLTGSSPRDFRNKGKNK
ncbi:MULTISPECIES: response regulator transcription factor [unclassified Bacillus (in: firmicutes)]|uniref:response regulator transcription factor n=1 Tax=unclassified Bacillus (in: firmicutes) TaxID=185979 RepID=UPI002FFDC235